MIVFVMSKLVFVLIVNVLVDIVLHHCVVHFSHIANRDRGQRSVPRTIVAFQRDDGRMGDIAIPLHRTRVVRAVSKSQDQEEPEDTARTNDNANHN